MATATVAAGLSDIPKTLSKGAKKVIATESLATVGGFALSRVVEKSLWGVARGIFGFDDGETEPTQGQKLARTGSKIAVAVLAGGLLVGANDKHMRAAGLGLMAGATWHALNDFGINV